MRYSRPAVAGVFAAGIALAALPAAAECTNVFCELFNKIAPPPVAPEPPAPEPEEPAKPVQWGAPVDIRPAIQSETKPTPRVAKRSSSDAPVAGNPRKKKAETTAKASSAQVKPAAAGAYALDYAALVREVAAEDVNEIDLAAPDTPAEVPAAEPADDPTVQVVDASELNELDRQAVAARAEPREMPAREVAADQSEYEQKSWMQRVRGVFGSAFGSAMNMVSAAMRSLFG